MTEDPRPIDVDRAAHVLEDAFVENDIDTGSAVSACIVFVAAAITLAEDSDYAQDETIELLKNTVETLRNNQRKGPRDHGRHSR